jgi:hypothetical protein
MVQCIFDTTVFNTDTVSKFTNLGLSIFAVLCGKNRGVFVDPKDPAGTYSCLTLPPSFKGNANIMDDTITMSTSNDIGTYLWERKCFWFLLLLL